MTFHLGLHWNMMIRRIKWSSRKGCFYVATLIALYGLWVLVKRDIGTYLFLRTEFVFLDYGESRTLFYLDYLAMMGLFIYLAHYVGKFLQRLGRSNKKGE